MTGGGQAALARPVYRAAAGTGPKQWDDVRHWRTYRSGGERWFGFEAVRDLDGLPPEILMIPLPGHTGGHAGVAIRHAERLASQRRRRLLLPPRDGSRQPPVPARRARLPTHDGRRPRSASPQPGARARARPRTPRGVRVFCSTMRSSSRLCRGSRRAPDGSDRVDGGARAQNSAPSRRKSG